PAAFSPAALSRYAMVVHLPERICNKKGLRRHSEGTGLQSPITSTCHLGRILSPQSGHLLSAARFLLRFSYGFQHITRPAGRQPYTGAGAARAGRLRSPIRLRGPSPRRPSGRSSRLSGRPSCRPARHTRTRTPGPIVDEMTTLLMYTPFAAAGLARLRVSISAIRFSSSLFDSKDTLPIGACTIPALSRRNSIFPALISCTALPTSKVTVPAFGFGMRPL